MKPQGWQNIRQHRSSRQGDFNLPVDIVPDDPDDDAGKVTIRKPHPQRRWRCRECGLKYAFGHTLDAHIASVHAPLRPPPVIRHPHGPAQCRWCPAGYASEAERTLHEQAKHPRQLAIELGS